MKTTKVFKSGNSQAVRLPKEFQLDCDEVEITRKNDVITIYPKRSNLAEAFSIITSFPEDCFSTKRIDASPQERDFFE